MALSPDRIKHLEFIQATISRQASNSFALKGWALTVATAVYAYTAANLSWWLAVMALLPPIAFGWLDTYYLRQERLFRELYKDVAEEDSAVPPFSMNTQRYCDAGKYPTCRMRSAWRSDTIRVFYGLILAFGLALLGIALLKGLGATELADCVRDAV